MMRSAAWNDLVGVEIMSTKCGHKDYPRLGSYGATTLVTSAGTFVVWQSYGEVNLSKEID
jgi:hypothetical protein